MGNDIDIISVHIMMVFASRGVSGKKSISKDVEVEEHGHTFAGLATLLRKKHLENTNTKPHESGLIEMTSSAFTCKSGKEESSQYRSASG